MILDKPIFPGDNSIKNLVKKNIISFVRLSYDDKAIIENLELANFIS